MPHQINIAYFAWVKEGLGRDQDIISYPENVETIGQLIEYLQSKDAVYGDVFANLKRLRFALDQEFAGLDAKLNHASELAIFPPVTGG